MRKMKTGILYLALCICMLTGCSSSRTVSLTFKVGTGDNIKVTLDTSDGLGLSQTESGFSVTEDGNAVLQAFFVEQAVYQQYMESVANQEGVTVNEQKSEEGITYLSYTYAGEAGVENNFIVWIEGSSTGVVIGSLSDLQTATGAFQNISFSKE